MKRREWIRFAALVFGLLISGAAHAYPEFIGYGYTTCLTCHWSGAGGGGLNDYGRALFAGEIAARPPFFSGDDDALASYSGFLGKVPTPDWFKPAIKYRDLYYEVNPGSSQQTSRYYTMQSDFNIASFTNESRSLGVVATLSYVGDPTFASPNVRINGGPLMAREYYVRYQMSKALWWYVGFMDKAYGIRHPDHTAFNRSPLELGQNDQVHGVQMQYQNGLHELFVQPFIGNVHLAGNQQSKGISALYEYEACEMCRIGASAKFERSDVEAIQSIALHARIGVPKGHALLTEWGVKKDQLGAQPWMLGAYSYFELNYLLVRGLNFQSILQYDKEDFYLDAPDSLQWGLGFLYFPVQRIELRLQALQERLHQDGAVKDDLWALQAQVHLSL